MKFRPRRRVTFPESRLTPDELRHLSPRLLLEQRKPQGRHARADRRPNHGDLSYYYLATADVIIPTVNSKNATNPNDLGNVSVRVRRVFQKETISLWRYAIFYDDDLEIHPGAPWS